MRVPPRSSTRSGRASISWTSWGGRAAQARRRALEGPLPLPSGEDAVVHGQPEAEHLLLLRLSRRRRRLRVPAPPRPPRVSRGRAPPGRARGRPPPGARGDPRDRSPRRAPRAHGMGLAPLRGGALGGAGGGARPHLPPDSRDRPRHRARLPPGLCARGLGPPPRRRAPGGPSGRGVARGGARDPPTERLGPLRPFPRPADLPDRGHAGARHRVRRPRAGRRGAQVPELPGDPALPEGADPLLPPSRARAHDGDAAARSWSRATSTA